MSQLTSTSIKILPNPRSCFNFIFPHANQPKVKKPVVWESYTLLIILCYFIYISYTQCLKWCNSSYYDSCLSTIIGKLWTFICLKLLLMTPLSTQSKLVSNILGPIFSVENNYILIFFSLIKTAQKCKMSVTVSVKNVAFRSLSLLDFSLNLLSSSASACFPLLMIRIDCKKKYKIYVQFMAQSLQIKSIAKTIFSFVYFMDMDM